MTLEVPLEDPLATGREIFPLRKKIYRWCWRKKIERMPAMISGSWKQKRIFTSHTSYPKNRHFAQDDCEWTWAFPNGLLDHEVMIQRIVPCPVLQMNKLDRVHLFCSLFWKNWIQILKWCYYFMVSLKSCVKGRYV